MKKFKYRVFTLDENINQKLVDNHRIKLFSKVKDALERNKRALKKEEVEFKKWLKNKNFMNIFKPINNSWFIRNLGA